MNKNGNLKRPIIYKTISDIVETGPLRDILKILNTLDEKVDQIKNPTHWLRNAISSIPTLDTKVHQTIWWYNDHGGLQQPIQYNEVKGDLGKLEPREALRILHCLEGKTDIQNPTAWICN